MRLLRRGSGRTRILRWMQAVLGVALAAATFYLLSRFTDGAAVFNALQYFKWHMLFLIVPLFALQVWSRVIRWSQILEKDTAGKSLLFSSMMTGYAVNALFPAGFGEASRIYVLRRKGSVPIGQASASVLLERGLDILFAALLVGGSALTLELPSWAYRSALIGGAFSLVIVLGFAAMSRFRHATVARLVPPLQNTPMIRLLEVLRTSLELYAEVLTSGRWVHVLVWSCVIWALAVGVTHGFLLSFDVNAPLWASILIVGATSLGMAVPTAPAYLGVYHGIVVACLSLFGVHADTALAAALVLHAFGFFPSAAIGLYCIWSGKLLINSTQTNENLE